MRTSELPPPPWPLATSKAPVEARWWRKDIPSRTVRRFAYACLLALLGGCIAMCEAEQQEGQAGRRQAVAALDQIPVPGSFDPGPVHSMGCNDYQFPVASRTDRSNLPPAALRRAMASPLADLGWTRPTDEDPYHQFRHGDLTLDIDLVRSGDGSAVTLRVQKSSVVC